MREIGVRYRAAKATVDDAGSSKDTTATSSGAAGDVNSELAAGVRGLAL